MIGSKNIITWQNLIGLSLRIVLKKYQSVQATSCLSVSLLCCCATSSLIFTVIVVKSSRADHVIFELVIGRLVC